MDKLANWENNLIYPSDMFEPRIIVTKSFPFGSIAGCLGNEIQKRKPGINEDAGGVYSLNKGEFVLSILIDGHKERDTTEILLDLLSSSLNNLNEELSYGNFTEFCDSLVKSTIASLKQHNAVGEASFLIFGINTSTKQLYYFSVGDVMLFLYDPKRWWGSYFQISGRHYFEWINKEGVSGVHSGKIEINNKMELIATTDGLIDEPVITMEQIEKLFSIKAENNRAKALVKHALEHNQDHDDNTITVYIDMSKLLF